LADYSPSPAWFDAIDAYGEGVWWRILELSEWEPKWNDVLDAWALRTYGLQKPIDSEKAWRVFERICQDADREQYYHTGHIDGRVVEIIAPELDPVPLIQLAIPLLSDVKGYAWHTGKIGGRRHYGCVRNPARWANGGGLRGFVARGASGRESPARTFPVAHACWLLDKHLDVWGNARLNTIEARLVAEIVRAAHPNWNDALMRAAAILGGSNFDRFCLRQEWRTRGRTLWQEESAREDFMYVHGSKAVGKWLYLLACMNEPGAAKFRRQHTDEMLGMARLIAREAREEEIVRELEFVFTDLDRGSNSMAMRFWPQFLDRRSFGPSENQVAQNIKYLVRAEPLPTPKMYVQCFGGIGIEELEYKSEAYEPLKNLPRVKQREVFQALLTAFEQKRLGKDYHALNSDREIKRQLQLRLEHGADQQEINAASYMEHLTGPNGKQARQMWREHFFDDSPRIDHPLIGKLAVAEDPELRQMALVAICRAPTPEYRTLLEALRKDTDATVTEAADQVARELDVLRNEPPATFAAFSEKAE
jgi:hypothetical protein